MNLADLRHYKPQILALAQTRKIENIRIFGSVARGDVRPDSDIDFLVTPRPGCGLDFFGFAVDLEDLLHTKVDVVSDRAINRHIEQSILKDATPL